MDGMFTTLVSVRERLAAPRAGRSKLSPALLAAVAALHLGLFGAVILIGRAAPLPPPGESGTIEMVFAPPPAVVTALSAAPIPRAPQVAAAALAPTVPLAVTAAVPPADALVRAAPRVNRHRMASGQPGSGRVAAPAGAAPPVVAPAPALAVRGGAVAQAAAAVPSADTRRALAGWEAGISQAVQAAAVYPAMARLQHRRGRAQVRFDYRQGVVGQEAVVQPSHEAVLDRAAIAAVMHANLPLPPPAIGPQTRTMVVWVNFGLSAPD